MKKEIIKEEKIKELVIARLRTSSFDKKISIGQFGVFSNKELIEHVKKEDEVGRKIIKVQIEFLRSLKEDKF